MLPSSSRGVGWILDRYSIRAVGIALCLLLLAGALSLLWVERAHSPAALVTYAACFGFVIGGSDLYFVAFLRRRFPHVFELHPVGVRASAEYLAARQHVGPSHGAEPRRGRSGHGGP